MYTNLGTTASYIKLFALFVVLNILWFSVADRYSDALVVY